MPHLSIIPARAVSDRRLSRGGLLILAALGTYADKNGVCWPTQSEIAEQTGMTRQAVSGYLKELETLGYLDKRRRYRADQGEISCVYRIRFDADPATPPATSELAPPATSELAPPATSELDTPATSELYTPCNLWALQGVQPQDFTPPATSGLYTERPIERPIERPKKREGRNAAQWVEKNPSAQSAPHPQNGPGDRLPLDFVLPDDWKSWAEQRRPDLNITDEAEKFADYWRGKAGKEAFRTDWAATWRNWIRNAYTQRKTAPTSRTPLHQPAPTSAQTTRIASRAQAPTWLAEET